MGYNRLETEDIDSDGEFSHRGKYFNISVDLGINRFYNLRGRIFTHNQVSVYSIISVRRSRTLDFKNNNGNCMPVRSHSTLAVTSKPQETSSCNNPFDDSFNDVDCEDISKQPDMKINSRLASQTKHDNATQIPLKYITRPSSNSSPLFSYNITQPDVTHLVSPRASICSTPVMTGSELDLGDEGPSSDESWGMVLCNYMWG